jgi:hypothetical protein
MSTCTRPECGRSFKPKRDAICCSDSCRAQVSQARRARQQAEAIQELRETLIEAQRIVETIGLTSRRNCWRLTQPPEVTLQ